MGRDPYKYFRIEARELVDQLSRGALDLEKNTTSELVAHMLRLAHTLKGAARVVKCPDIGDRAHDIEDALSPLRDSLQPASKAQIDSVLKCLDEINNGIAALSPPVSTPKPQQEPAIASGTRTGNISKREASRMVRVDSSEMDALLDGFVELHAQLGSLRDCQQRAAEVRNLMTLVNIQIGSHQERLPVLRGGESSKRRVDSIAEQVVTSFGRMQRNLATSIEQLDRELTRIRDAAERMRLIPAENMFVTLERAARDAAQFQNKKIVFEVRGGAIRLNARIMDTMQAALAHAVRNAVAHGIETAAERETAAKPAEGKIIVEVLQQGRDTVFRCVDDGRGIDFDAIRKIAEQRGLLSGESKAADNETLLQLLLKGGISTSGAVTEIAGRGVGLDAVRDAIEQLQGKIGMTTNAGSGTTLTLTVPLSIAALDVLQVESAGIVAAIPIDVIVRTMRITTDDIATAANGKSVIHEGKLIPFLPLGNVLSRTADIRRNRNLWSMVIVKADCGLAAIGVDRLLGASDVVLRPLPALAPASAIVAGVSLDMEGNAQLVLDARHLVAAAQRAGTAGADPQESGVKVLVVDDSLTTRMLERSILESAGYDVELAASGEEALEKAARNRYALFLVDAEMPGIDGFTFIERIRSDPALHNIPAILVTSRASPEDLQRGRDVGANGHIVKSEFDQTELLSRIRELAG